MRNCALVLLFVVFGVIPWSTAVAERIVGNGGIGVECFDHNGVSTSLEILDFLDGRVLWEHTHVLGPKNAPFEEKRRKVLQRAFTRDPGRAVLVAESTRRFFENTRFLRNVELTSTQDDNNLFLPLNCKKVQLVIQREPRFPGERRFVVDQNKWELLDDENQLALILHEVIYQEALAFGQKDSSSTRYITSLWSSDNFRTTSSADYADILRRTGFPVREFAGIELVSNEFVLKLLPAEFWNIRSDKIERGGKSNLTVETDQRSGSSQTIRFDGVLDPILEQTGARGFAGARIPVAFGSGPPPTDDRILEFSFTKVLAPVVLSVSIQNELGQFQRDIQLAAGDSRVKVNLDDFVLVNRGIPDPSRSLSSWSSINEIGFVVLYSRQNLGNSGSIFPFTFDVNKISWNSN
jgi:hypothetical protein